MNKPFRMNTNAHPFYWRKRLSYCLVISSVWISPQYAFSASSGLGLEPIGLLPAAPIPAEPTAAAPALEVQQRRVTALPVSDSPSSPLAPAVEAPVLDSSVDPMPAPAFIAPLAPTPVQLSHITASAPVIKGQAVEVPKSPDGDLFSAWRPQTAAAAKPTDIASPAHSAAPIQVEKPVAELWDVSAGGTLESLISDWALRAGWRVEWATDLDYPMVAPFTIEGDFLEAIAAIFNAYSQAERSFRVEAFQNQVLVVSEKK